MTRSCWNCAYKLLGGAIFPAACTWFTKKKGQPAKEVPLSIVDQGCKFWELEKPKEKKDAKKADSN